MATIKYPAIPKTIEAPGGPVTVTIGTVSTGEKDMGCWDPDARAISIRTGIAPRMQWSTFYHEATHVALADSGLGHLLSDKQQEAICDAVATARLRERFG